MQCALVGCQFQSPSSHIPCLVKRLLWLWWYCPFKARVRVWLTLWSSFPVAEWSPRIVERDPGSCHIEAGLHPLHWTDWQESPTTNKNNYCWKLESCHGLKGMYNIGKVGKTDLPSTCTCMPTFFVSRYTNVKYMYIIVSWMKKVKMYFKFLDCKIRASRWLKYGMLIFFRRKFCWKINLQTAPETEIFQGMLDTIIDFYTPWFSVKQSVIIRLFLENSDFLRVPKPLIQLWKEGRCFFFNCFFGDSKNATAKTFNFMHRYE